MKSSLIIDARPNLPKATTSSPASTDRMSHTPRMRPRSYYAMAHLRPKRCQRQVLKTARRQHRAHPILAQQKEWTATTNVYQKPRF
jgi:hypothetical protein